MTARGHRYTVELRVFGESLDPDRITRETGLIPCQSWLAGSRIGTKVRDEGMWAFDGNESYQFDDLEDGLRYVMEKAKPAEAVFSRYRTEFRLVWWIGHFQSGFDGGPWLSPGLLQQLVAFGAVLFIDNYFERVDGR